MKYNLVIGWLYPDLMSTYGDRGNIIVLQKRCLWRGINTKLIRLNLGFNINDLKECDILFMGGAQDMQQEIVATDLKGEKTKVLRDEIENGKVALFICGAYQFMGKYYKASDGKIIEGLSIFDLYTEHPGENKQRLIGNIIIKALNSQFGISNYVVGFENHGGRTYLSNNIKPFADVIFGHGNNDKDKMEGVTYKNAIGTYLHGPILPKNPEIADWLISKALELKYGKKINLQKLDDSLENQAKNNITKKIINE